MLSLFQEDGNSKSLYFKLNNSLHTLSPRCSSTYKIAGVYAIFKDDVCHYVGQSKNIPSRLSTHLCGKYRNADRVKIFFAGDTQGYPDYDCLFYEWSKDDQTEALENNEALCISFFKPIENIFIPESNGGDDDWILDPESESATIDIELDCFSVYFDPCVLSDASKLLKECFLEELKALKGVGNA